MGSTLDALEKTNKVISRAGDSYSKRLANLELKVFGEVKNGSLVDRLLRVQAASITTGETNVAPATGAGETNVAPTTGTGTATSSETTKATTSNPADQARGSARIIQYLNPLPLENTQLPMYFRIETAGTEDKEDYLKDILDATKQKVLRFKSMPIPVFVTPFQNKTYTRACIEGFESWEERTSGLIRFVQVDDPKEARIKVVWKRLGMSTDQNNCALGAHTVTKWQKKGSGRMGVFTMGGIPVPLYIPRFGPKYQVPPQVIEVNLDLIEAKIPEFRFILLKNIVTHELGHALGLLGHSDTNSDIMFAVTDENSRISQRDINTLTRLYQMKADIPL